MSTAVVQMSLPVIRAQIATYEKVLENLRTAETILVIFDASVDPRKYSGKSKATSLAEYLRERGGMASFNECHDALQRGGCDLGSRSQANLKTTITTNRDSLAMRGDRIFLVG
jgi:hypothetical protein